MFPTRRFFILGTAALTGCSRLPGLPARPLESIILDRAFAGRAVGAGVFQDVIYFGRDGRVINDAIVIRWGFPMGRVRFEMPLEMRPV